MKMIPYDVDTYKHIKPSNNLKILEEFAGSGMKCVKLVGWTQKTLKFVRQVS